jgi:hypothetical protein
LTFHTINYQREVFLLRRYKPDPSNVPEKWAEKLLDREAILDRNGWAFFPEPLESPIEFSPLLVPSSRVLLEGVRGCCCWEEGEEEIWMVVLLVWWTEVAAVGCPDKVAPIVVVPVIPGAPPVVPITVVTGAPMLDKADDFAARSRFLRRFLRADLEPVVSWPR